MPRPKRPVVAGGVYHVYARSIRTSSLFVDDDDRIIFLSLLALVAIECNLAIEGYCLMGNHYHVVLRTPDANISEAMQLLNGRYAMLFNAKYGFRGHLFDGRFKCRVIQSERDLHDTLLYVEHNPVRHRIRRRAVDWPWSSARRRAAPALRSHIDFVTMVGCHTRHLDDATELFERIVRFRWGKYNRETEGLRPP